LRGNGLRGDDDDNGRSIVPLNIKELLLAEQKVLQQMHISSNPNDSEMLKNMLTHDGQSKYYLKKTYCLIQLYIYLFIYLFIYFIYKYITLMNMKIKDIADTDQVDVKPVDFSMIGGLDER